MSHIKKNSVLKAFVICFSFIIIGNLCLAYICHNGSTGGYDDETQPPGIQSYISMEILVIEGAGYFLQTHTKVQTLLNMVELQDIKAIDHIELKRVCKSSLIAIINARITFEELIKVAEVTPYNLDVIEKLNNFDYDNFMKEYELNHYIFSIVMDYLVKGDITGTFKHAHSNFTKIEQLLMNIQTSILENRLPELEILWKLNELCAEETPFGSYIARIFKTIK